MRHFLLGQMLATFFCVGLVAQNQSDSNLSEVGPTNQMMFNALMRLSRLQSKEAGEAMSEWGAAKVRTPTRTERAEYATQILNGVKRFANGIPTPKSEESDWVAGETIRLATLSDEQKSNAVPRILSFLDSREYRVVTCKNWFNSVELLLTDVASEPDDKTLWVKLLAELNFPPTDELIESAKRKEIDMTLQQAATFRGWLYFWAGQVGLIAVRSVEDAEKIVKTPRPPAENTPP